MKNLAKLGKALNKSEQQAINGGAYYERCDPRVTCPFSPPCASDEYEWCCKCYSINY